MDDNKDKAEQAQTAGAAKGGNTSIKGLTRYGFDRASDCFVDQEDGEYVKFSDVASLASQSQAAQPTGNLTDAQISAAARHMSDRSAAVCNVDKDDNWKVYGQDFIDELREAIEAGIKAAPAAHLAGTSRATKAQAEPVEYQGRMRPMWRRDGEGWTEWATISRGTYDDYIRVPVNGDWQFEARALYSAPVAKEAPAVPEGFALVPLKLTPEMRAAWDKSPQYEDDSVEFAEAYRAMLAAAPQAPVAKAEHEMLDARLLVDVATAVLEQLGMLQGLNEHRTAELCDWLQAAFDNVAKEATKEAETGSVQIDVEAIHQIADELELEASSYEGDFADTVNGCADALRHLIAPTTSTVSAPGMTMGEAFKAVGGWMNGGELGYPTFGSMDALWAYTVKMTRGSTEGTQAAPEEVRNQALAEAEDAVDKIMSEADDSNESAEAVGAYRCLKAIQALRDVKGMQHG